MGTDSTVVTGWDIGGVNTKVASVDGGRVVAVRSQAYELQRAPAELASLLRRLAVDVGAAPSPRHAVTMTAELSQMFRRKRDGVHFVLDAVESAFPDGAISVYTTDGVFVSTAAARQQPLRVAAANWMATAQIVAQLHPDAMLIDTGTTTTDIIPIVNGVVAAQGRTDPERLASGELVYTGAVRTPIEAILRHVPTSAGGVSAVSAESFSLVGDVHIWRGDLHTEQITAPTPDGRPSTREFAAERLARVVCADRDMLDDGAVSLIADAVAAAQVEQIAGAIRQVAARHPTIRDAVVTGLGAFLAVRAAEAAGLRPCALAADFHDAQCAPAAAVALLLDGAAKIDAQTLATTLPPATISSPRIVVKIGGALLRHPEHLTHSLAVVATAAAQRPIAIVPGGGPFADVVRDVDARYRLTDDAAHWMAILAMDQYAHLLASRLPRGVVAESEAEVGHAWMEGNIPVLAPSAWLRRVDPLPHSWEITSDSIAAWIAGAIGASELVLIKAPGAGGDTVVDPSFARALPPSVTATIVTADRLQNAVGVSATFQ